MGEIGIPRREFLFDLQFWEIRRIIRGYRNRHKLTHQLLAECAYASTFSMRSPEGKRIEDMFPYLFDDDDIEPAESMSEDDVRELQGLIQAVNEKGTM